jgi:hypothetical protein
MLKLIRPKPSSVIYNGPHYQIEFQHCWAPWLNNPLLNKLYKDSVCYTERWYLETRRLINEGLWTHPLLNSIVQDPNMKSLLVRSTVIDGAMLRSVLQNESYPEFHISAGINLKKINRWCAFFVSLPDSLEILVSLNDPLRD